MRGSEREKTMTKSSSLSLFCGNTIDVEIFMSERRSLCAYYNTRVYTYIQVVCTRTLLQRGQGTCVVCMCVQTTRVEDVNKLLNKYIYIYEIKTYKYIPLYLRAEKKH